MSRWRLRSRECGVKASPGSGAELSEIDEQLSPHYIFEGEESSAWRLLLSLDPVREVLIGWTHSGVRVRLKEAHLELLWPDPRAEIIEQILDQTLALSVAMVSHPKEGWRRAASVLDATLQIQEDRWSIEGGDRWTGQIILRPSPQGWCTHLSLPLHDIPTEWSIRAGSTGDTRQRTGDPILDAQVLFEGIEPDALSTLCREPGATELLISCTCGHRLRLESGQLRVEHPGLIAEPLELMTDALSWMALLTTTSQDIDTSSSPESGRIELS